MKQAGRTSRDALALAAYRAEPERLQPSPGLTEPERRLFVDLVLAASPTHFHMYLISLMGLGDINKGAYGFLFMGYLPTLLALMTALAESPTLKAALDLYDSELTTSTPAVRAQLLTDGPGTL